MKKHSVSPKMINTALFRMYFMKNTALVRKWKSHRYSENYSD